MENKVYVVTRGSYSDYSICAIFTSRYRAKKYIEAYEEHDTWVDFNRIETWELNPEDANLIRKGYTTWAVTMLRDGTVENIYDNGVGVYRCAATSAFIWRRSQASAYRGTNTPDALRVDAWTTSKEHAIKIANDIRRQKIAEGEWNG